ncbi:MAG: hypothetical protein ACRYFX_21205 [Janthinobacterium lividum]
MSLQVFTSQKPKEFYADEEYEQGGDPDYDDAPQAGGSEGADPDYADDLRDADADDGGSQEWRLRPQR